MSRLKGRSTLNTKPKLIITLSQIVNNKFSHTTLSKPLLCTIALEGSSKSEVIVRNLKDDYNAFVPQEHSFDWSDEVALLSRI